MLKRLSISQFVIIEKLTVAFDSGLTVLTGETGAGKSILLDAMGLILGDDPDREAIRQSCDQSSFEALFIQPPDHPVWAFLASHEGFKATPSELVIRRTFDRLQKDEIFVNDSPVELPLLKELGTYLVEIHGQFANQTFLAPESQLSLLDAFGAYPPEILNNVKQAWDDIGRLTRELDEERKFFASAEREKVGIERTVKGIEKIGLQKGMVEKMKDELARLINSRDICELFQSINAQLVAQSGVDLSLGRVARLLDTQKDPALDTMKASIKAAREQTAAAIREMQILTPKYINVDTSGIHPLEKKLEEIEAIAKERKVKVEELYDHYAVIAERLKRIRNAPVKIKELNDKLIKATETYREHAHILTEHRRLAAQQLGEAVTAEMAPLKLLSAQAEIEVSEDTTKRTPRGFNEVAFLARMNPGMPFSPISKTASGGEMARLILAVKMILQRVQAVSTLVFDEIDTGIGGAAAAAVGSRIASLADKAQILVITHSPQVASRGNQHLHVSKQTDGTSTHTVVETLSLEKRIQEVSRMLAGEEVTVESLAAAKTLIEEAHNAATKNHAPA